MSIQHLCTLRCTHKLLHRLTFSSSCLSCFVRASREHMVCWGATTVQIHLPSLSWAELYTCQLSSGLVGSTWRGQVRQGNGKERKGESKARPQRQQPGRLCMSNPGKKKKNHKMCKDKFSHPRGKGVHKESSG
jgi:hypothetical protein